MRKVLVLSAIFFLIGAVGCKKDGKLTPDFDNGGLNVHFVDTFTIYTSLELDDSLRTDFSLLNPLGLYDDPIFGPMSSSIYTQVLLNGINVDFGNNIEVDSIVLTLDYEKVYGYEKAPMNINVYEITEDLSSSNEYYSNTKTAHATTPIATKKFVPNLVDNVTILHDSSTLNPHLRIRLPDSLANRIISNDPYPNNSSLLSVFKGLYITTVDSVTNFNFNKGRGSIITFDLNSALSTITLYYHKLPKNHGGGSLGYKPLKYDFTINTSAVKYCRFDHDYTGTDIEAHLNNLPTKDTLISYVSALAGVKTKIEIPFVKNLAEDGNVIINKAEVEITVEGGTEGNFDTPLESISLVGINENGDDVFLPDFFEGLDYYGGTYDTQTKKYKFNIARHINDLVNANGGNYGMYIVANGGTTTASRSVIGSERNTTAKIKLNITYSKL